MSPEPLRIAAFCVYLAAWAILAAVAAVKALPRRAQPPVASMRLTASVLAGMLLQVTSPLPITLTLTEAPLRPGAFETITAIAFAVLAAGIFCWAMWSTPSGDTPRALVTGGAYAWLRHPIYFSFLSMLLSTGLIVSAAGALIVAVVIYLAGTELRIASEEAELKEKFPIDYPRYRLRTRWRYLPGLR